MRIVRVTSIDWLIDWSDFVERELFRTESKRWRIHHRKKWRQNPMSMGIHCYKRRWSMMRTLMRNWGNLWSSKTRSASRLIGRQLKTRPGITTTFSLLQSASLAMEVGKLTLNVRASLRAPFWRFYWVGFVPSYSLQLWPKNKLVEPYAANVFNVIIRWR